MLETIKTENILFIDIETVPCWPTWESMPDAFKTCWEKKSSYFRKETETASDVYNRAGIYAEFGKIICISAGMIFKKNNENWFRIKSFAGDDEKKNLEGFIEMLQKYTARGQNILCAHNGKEFDFPYIARRILVNKLTMPALFDIAGKKPWEVPFLDTLELWKFGDYKHYTSLDLLANLFNISNPKDEMDGSMVADTFYKEKNLNKIINYCQKDVFTVAQLFLSYRNENHIPNNHIEIVN